MKKTTCCLSVLGVGLLLWLAVLGCEAGAGAGDDYDESGGTDGDADSDTDTDTDTDTDSDSDGDSDGDTDPEVEEEADYRVPQGSGRYVFIADGTNDALVVVDSETLVIDVVEVGARPTHVVPLGEHNAAAVINVDSDEVSIVRVDSGGVPTLVDVEVRPDTNALAVSSDGDYIVAFYDELFEEETGAPQTDQEITVIDTSEGAEESFHMIVGMHPSEVIFNDDDTNAFVITEEGISVIDLTTLGTVGLPPQVSMFDSTVVDPSTVEIAIDPAGTIALARQEGSATIVTAALSGASDERSYTLPGVPTDLDIADDGSYGVFVLRDTSQVAFFELPLPSDASADPFTYVDLGDRVCGVATMVPGGDRILLHTTTGGDELDRKVLTELSWTGSAWDADAVLTEREIKSVAAGPDGESAVVIHDPVSTSSGVLPYAYTIVNLSWLQLKFQQISVTPGQLLLTPDGGYGFILLRDDSASVKAVDKLDLSTFIVDSITLGSPPTASGYASGTDKVFISQEHTAGRMTFIGVADGSVQTVTGYALNDEIGD